MSIMPESIPQGPYAPEPPPEPEYDEPTAEDITAAIQRVAGDVVLKGVSKDPFEKAVLRALQDLDWTEMLSTARCLGGDDWGKLIRASVDDLRGTFHDLLATTPAEEWPV